MRVCPLHVSLREFLSLTSRGRHTKVPETLDPDKYLPCVPETVSHVTLARAALVSAKWEKKQVTLLFGKFVPDLYLPHNSGTLEM